MLTIITSVSAPTAKLAFPFCAVVADRVCLFTLRYVLSLLTEYVCL